MKMELGPAKLETTEADYDALQKVSKVGIFQIISDQLGYWRQCNLMRISKKFKKRCEKHNINPQQVSPKFLAQFIEASSYDDEDSIQDIWAGLLAREAQRPGRVSFRTIALLKTLSPDEARTFQSLRKNAIRLGPSIAIYNDIDSNKDGIDDIIRLVDCGILVSENANLTASTRILASSTSMVSQSIANRHVIIARNQSDEDTECVIPIFSLTQAGQDIINATDSTEDNYLAIARKIKNKNSALEIKLFEVEAYNENSGGYSARGNDLLD